MLSGNEVSPAETFGNNVDYHKEQAVDTTSILGQELMLLPAESYPLVNRLLTSWEARFLAKRRFL